MSKVDLNEIQTQENGFIGQKIRKEGNLKLG